MQYTYTYFPLFAMSQLMMDVLALLIDGYHGFEPVILDLKLPRNIALLLNVDYAQVDLVLTSLASVLNTTRTSHTARSCITA